MNLEYAEKLAQNIVAKLQPYCSRVQVAGSIRRRKSWVNDIDIVLIPSNQGQLLAVLQELGRIKSGAGKLINILIPLSDTTTYGVSVDFYIATPETWATLLLIRTGSKEHNIQLCSRARQMGMILHADGSGLFKIETCDVGNPREDRLAGDTEESLFEALGLPYKVPEERNK